MRLPRQAGFTLIEVTMALMLLAVMLSMLFAGLRTAARAWDAGSARGDRADQLALATTFLRRELSAAFPWRFKDSTLVRRAFEGDSESVRFVSMRPAELDGGGLAFVSFAFERGSGREPGRLVMRRALAVAAEPDFTPLDAAKSFVLLEDVESVRFGYYGSETDAQPLEWFDRWKFPQRLPTHVRLSARLASGELPDLVVAMRIAEESGCIEASFQRNCVPRR